MISDRSFLTLFRLHLKHDYYSDGRCPDFVIEPRGDTKKLLRGRYVGLKSGSDWVSLHLDPDRMLLEPEAAFLFRLRMRRPDFALYTDVEDILKSAAPLYTHDQPVSVPTTDQHKQLRPVDRPPQQQETFVVSAPATAESFTLSGRPVDCSWNTAFQVAGTTSVTITGYEAASKVVTVDSHLASQDDPFTITYPGLPGRRRDVFADVEIRAHETWQSVRDTNWKPPEFDIAFNCKSKMWIYYLVTDRTGGDFQITDQDAVITFPAANRQELDPASAASDEIAAWLEREFPGLRRIRFVSQDPVPCRQAARKGIRLLDGTNLLLSPLPNPSLRNLTENPLDPAATPGDSLFQVVKL